MGEQVEPLARSQPQGPAVSYQPAFPQCEHGLLTVLGGDLPPAVQAVAAVVVAVQQVLGDELEAAFEPCTCCGSSV